MKEIPAKEAQQARIRVLVADDDRAFAGNLMLILSEKYDVGVAYNGSEVLERIRTLGPEVLLLDIEFGDKPDGLAVLAELQGWDSRPEVIMLTGSRDIKVAVQAIKCGAFHFMCKNPNLAELDNLINLAALNIRQRRRLQTMEMTISRLSGDFIVQDPAMKKVLDDVERVAETEATVIILGETGTGKEMVARHIHKMSPRADGPFIPVNCGGIPGSLIESELFGYVRGAFTEAKADHDGYFQQARGGTLFLDEIGNAPHEVQQRLLRVLENRTLRRVGGTREEQTDVRVLAATSADLQEAVATKEFREDLYYRLNVYGIEVPPLRRRPGDIIPLAEYFLAFFCAQMGRGTKDFSPAARKFLQACDWPGNVRLLQNVVQRAVIDCRGAIVDIVHLANSIESRADLVLPKDVAFQRFRKKYVTEALQNTRGNIDLAVKLTGLSRKTIFRILEGGPEQDPSPF